MKIALSIGHSPQDGGAVSTYGFWREHVVRVKEELERLGHVAVVCNRTDAGGTTPSFAAKACNATGADLAVEFHFNSAGSGATGTETLCFPGSKNGARAAGLIQAAMCDVLRLPDRGVKGVADTGRGYMYFKKTVMPAVMVEPAFAGSNVTDYDRLKERVAELCVAVARAIDKYFKEG